jgi:hypothetical protein
MGGKDVEFLCARETVLIKIVSKSSRWFMYVIGVECP